MLDQLTAAVDAAFQTAYVKETALAIAGAAARSLVILCYKSLCWLFTPAELSEIAAGVVRQIRSGGMCRRERASAGVKALSDSGLSVRDGAKGLTVHLDGEDQTSYLTDAERRAIKSALFAEVARQDRAYAEAVALADAKEREAGRALLAERLNAPRLFQLGGGDE